MILFICIIYIYLRPKRWAKAGETMESSLIRNSTKEYFIKHCSLSMTLINSIITIVTAVSFYYILPTVLNYPPDFLEYNKRFAFNYTLQFFILVPTVIIIGGFILRKLLKPIDIWGRL